MAGLLTRFFGRTASEGAAFALGTAVGPTLTPAVRELVNEAWSTYPTAPLGAVTLAQGVATGQVDRSWATDEAANSGINPDRFGRLVAIFDTGPGVAQAFIMWRRGSITDKGFERALKREGLEDEWVTALKDEHDVLLTPAQVALGIVRSLLKDPGFLPVDLDTSGGTVEAYPVSPLDPVAEAGKSGVTKERLRVMVGEIGLPMALQSAASAVFRGIIRRPDFNRAVLEGDTRPEWADAIFEQARQIPSVADYVNAHIRGWISEDAMHAGAAKHGMSPADVDLLYLRTGRPAAPGQMWTAWARGIDGPDGVPMNEAQFQKGIRQSDIRPEWEPMLWGIRFTYPPLFQIGRLVQAGAIDVDTAASWCHKNRLAPEVIDALKAYWSGGTGPAVDPNVAKAQTQLWTTTHRSYVADETDDATAAKQLTTLGITGASQTAVLKLWQAERALIRKQLTAAQVKKAYIKSVKNQATGAAWTRDDAIAALVDRGYSVGDATTFIDT